MIGLHTVTVALHPEVEIDISVNVARSPDEAERQARGEDLTSAEAIYGIEEEEDLAEEDLAEGEAEPAEGSSEPAGEAEDESAAG